MFYGLMPLVRSPWNRIWSPRVYAVDASLYGFGLAVSDWSPDEVAKVARTPERRRWKLSAEPARTAALHAAGFKVDDGGRLLRDEAGRPERLAKEEEEYLKSLRWSADRTFDEVLASLLAEKD